MDTTQLSPPLRHDLEEWITIVLQARCMNTRGHYTAVLCAVQSHSCSFLSSSILIYDPPPPPNELPMRTELGSPMTKIMSGSIIE